MSNYLDSPIPPDLFHLESFDYSNDQLDGIPFVLCQSLTKPFEPKNKYNYFWHGIVNILLKKYKNAAIDFKKSIQVDDSFWYAYLYHTIACMKISKDEYNSSRMYFHI